MAQTWAGLVTAVLTLVLGLASLTTQAVTVAYWQFESADLTADSSGNGNVLANIGVVSTADVAANAPGTGSAVFDGINASAATVENLNLSAYKAVTLECFIKTNGQASLAILAEHSAVTGSNPGGFYLDFNEPGGQFRALLGSSPNTTRAVPHPYDSDWHHYAVTIDNSGANAAINIYIDGVLQTGTVTVNASKVFRNDRFYVGARNNSQFRFNGKVDEFRISSRVLPPSGFLIAPPLVGAAIQVTQPPTNTTVLQNRAVSFAVGATLQNGDPELLEYQWRTNGVYVPGATASALTLPRAYFEYNGMEVAVEIAVHAKGGVTPVTNAVTLTVTPDLVAPVASKAVAQVASHIGVYFNEPVDATSAANAAFYTLNGDAAVYSAHPLADGQTVVLKVSELSAPSYTLTLNGVTDWAGNPANSAVMVTNQSDGFTALDIGTTPVGLVHGTNWGNPLLLGGGLDIWGPADGINYIYKELTGDFDVRLRINAIGGVNTSSRGGLMVRETTDPGSRNVFMGTYVSANNNWVATHRAAANGTTAINGGALIGRGAGFAFPNAWVRISRVGQSFASFYSTNNLDWVQYGTTFVASPAYPDTVLVGMASTTISDTVAGNFQYADFKKFSLAGGTIVITTQPTNQTVLAYRPVTFAVAAEVQGVSEPVLLAYQWLSNNVPIEGAVFPTYTIPQTPPSASGKQYRCLVSALGIAPVSSAAATLTVTADTAAPVVLCTSSLDGQTVGVRFDEPVTPLSAEDPAHYGVSGGAVVYGATLRPDGRSVVLAVAGLTGGSYVLDVAGVRDLSANPATNSINGIVQGITPEDIGWPTEAGSAFSCLPGNIEVRAGGFDVWFNTDSFHFTHLERTGDFDIRVRVASFGPGDANANAKAVLMARESLDWGSRHVSITVYPRMGNWTAFQRADSMGASSVLSGNWRINWPAGNNYPNAWMRLKRSGNTITTYGSGDGENWTPIGNPVTPETPFPETMQVGLGTTSLGDQFPPLPMVDVQYEQFGDYVISGATIVFSQQPTNTTVFENRSVTFSAAVQVTGTPASNVSFQWLKNDAPIPGATGASYTTPLLTLADNDDRYRVRASLPGGYNVLSAEATLTVLADVTPPAVSSIAALVGGPIGVRFNELLNTDSAANAAYYTLNGGATVTQATVLADGRSVVLLVNGLGVGPYQLTINGVADLKGNIASTSVPVNQLDWAWGDIGTVAEPGLAYAFDDEELNVRAGGADIWGSEDSFLFVHHARTGNFDVVVQLTQLSMVGFSTRGGLMVREDLTPQARNFFAGTYSATGPNQWVSTARLDPYGTTVLAPGPSYVARAPGFAFPNAWLRLKRAANLFTAFYSTNGVDWTSLGDGVSASAYPATVQLGLATTALSTTPGLAAAAQYLNFADWIEPAAPELTIAHSGSELFISWSASATGFTLKTASDLTTGPWTVVSEQPVSNGGYHTVTLQLEAGPRYYRLEK
jgi:hypothetical protein